MEADGYAIGPKIEVADPAVPVVIRAMWTDEDGVCVEVDSGDEPIPARLVARVCQAASRLSQLRGPAMAAVVAAMLPFVPVIDLGFSAV